VSTALGSAAVRLATGATIEEMEDATADEEAAAGPERTAEAEDETTGDDSEMAAAEVDAEIAATMLS